MPGVGENFERKDSLIAGNHLSDRYVHTIVLDATGRGLAQQISAILTLIPVLTPSPSYAEPSSVRKYVNYGHATIPNVN